MPHPLRIPTHFSREAADGPPDEELLSRYVSSGDTTAFALIVRRHGPLVRSVCRRVLGPGADADDAFQASFVVLFRRAPEVRDRGRLVGWLYGVAYRTAVYARQVRTRRRRREVAISGLEQVPGLDRTPDPELLAAVERALARLPDRYRTAVALCDLDGRSRAEVARLLRVPAGTVSSRLHTGRQLLAARLRPDTLAGLAALVSATGSEARVPHALVDRTVRSASGHVSPTVSALVSGVRPTMTAKWKLVVATTLVAVAGVVGTVAATGDGPPQATPDRRRTAQRNIAPVKAAAVADWPQFRGNPQSTGVGAAILPAVLNERWVFKCKDSVEGAPAVVGEVAYIASTDKHLYAVELATGKEKWKAKLGILKASPAVRSNRVYVGDVDGNVFCLTTDTGEQVWKYTSEVGGEIASGCNFHGENILVAAQGMPVTCLDKDGKKVWEFAIDGGSNGSPTVSGDLVFASGCDSAFHAIDAKTGQGVWSVELGGQAAATSATAGDFAYVGTVTNQVFAIDLKGKRKVWEFEPARKAQAFYASAAVTDELVVTGSRDKKVYALDRKTGKEAWSFVTDGMVDASPVVVGDRVYVGCLSLPGEFYVLDLKTGRKVQQITLDGGVCGSVAVGPDCILVGTDKGSVYCLAK